MEQESIFVGIDVAKAQLDVAVRPAADRWEVSHDDAGIRQLVSQLKSLGPAMVLVEASGGLELPLVAALATGELPVVVVNPRQVRDFARATGSVSFGCIAPNSHRDFPATYSTSKRNRSSVWHADDCLIHPRSLWDRTEVGPRTGDEQVVAAVVSLDVDAAALKTVWKRARQISQGGTSALLKCPTPWTSGADSDETRSAFTLRTRCLIARDGSLEDPPRRPGMHSSQETRPARTAARTADWFSL